MNSATLQLAHLDNLWLQVAGTLCNIACTHCFNSSGPGVRTFTLMEAGQVSRELRTAAAMGVKEIFFTGGEPFLHPRLPEMLEEALGIAPATVLTNGLLLRPAMIERLAAMERAARYSLEIRVSLDGYTAEANDAIRGEGVFERVLESVAGMSRAGLLPLVTMVRSWGDEEELATIAGFVRTLREAGCERPRLKILPALPLGRAGRAQGEEIAEGITEEMMRGFDESLLMCSNSRIVTSRGVWVCPLLVEAPQGRLGAHLEQAEDSFRLDHPVCENCYRYGTICANVSSGIEGTPDPRTVHGERG